MRAVVGIGEASYSTTAPTIIADLFTNNHRTLAMTVFFFAIPVGRCTLLTYSDSCIIFRAFSDK